MGWRGRKGEVVGERGEIGGWSVCRGWRVNVRLLAWEKSVDGNTSCPKRQRWRRWELTLSGGEAPSTGLAPELRTGMAQQEPWSPRNQSSDW